MDCPISGYIHTNGTDWGTLENEKNYLKDPKFLFFEISLCNIMNFLLIKKKSRKIFYFDQNN